MHIDKEKRFQYLYFLLSGLIINLLLVLAGLSVHYNFQNEVGDKVRQHLKSRVLVKPSMKWDYNNTWSFIGNQALKHKIFSAYYDSRTDVIEHKIKNSNLLTIGSIRIIAILPLILKDHFFCLLRYPDYSLQNVEPKQGKPVEEHHNLKFAVYTIMCPLYSTYSDTELIILPQEVALTYQSNAWSHIHPTFVPISYPRAMSQLFQKSQPVLSICVAPLHNHYSQVLRVVEFVEFYRLLGATHFYFYDINASQDVKRVLNQYRQQHLADVFYWSLLEYDNAELHDTGIAAQLNDCVYRAQVVDNYRYAAIIDLDEVLIPLKHNTLFEYLNRCDDGLVSAFVFRNVFFYNKDNADNFSVPLHTRNRVLYTQTKIRRNLDILPAFKQSKCIVNTRAIIEMGNYGVLQSVPGYNNRVLHHTMGLLHHYRDKCLNCKAILMVDYTARRFGSLLWDRVDEICLKAFIMDNGMCPLS